MPVHDAYARLTPFEIAFPDGAERLVRAVQQASEMQGDPGDVRAFFTSPAVGAVLDELRADNTGTESIHPLGMLAYQAYHFVRAGRPLLLVGTDVARRLTEGAAKGSEPTLPAEAGYLQLPQHLFWAPHADGAPESVDGFFWTRSPDGLLHVLLAMGVRRDRPGLVVAPVPDVPWGEAVGWLDVHARADGEDFAGTIPGGEIEGLHSLESAGEVLKLLARIMAYLHHVPESCVKGEPGEAPPEGPPASKLPYRRITLPEGEDAQRIRE